eukprot:scaffold14845_cov115-Skeletonema_dohrnii-CCMP3373.AAC.2
MTTCKHQLLHIILAALLCALILIDSTNGFLGSSCKNNDKLMARRMSVITTNTPSSPMLGRSSCLYVRRSYDDKSDEELFAALLADKKSKARDATASPISSLDTSRYAHLANITSPSPSIKPEDIIPLVMISLKNNDVPDKDAGMKLVWEFATDTTQYVFRNNRTEFIESCHETAEEFPTSFYGVAINGQSWNIETKLNRVGGESGWIATQVIKTVSSDGRLRRWQWELRKNKRPPCLGCWKIESIGSSDRNGDFEARDRGNGWSD